MSFDDLHVKPVVRIRNWWIEDNRLHGEVFGHPGNENGQFPDGSPVTTSTIINRSADGLAVETRNTMYQLDGPALGGDEGPEAPAQSKKKVYISGPITGKPNLNKEAFDAEAAKWRAQGYDVFNPQDIPAPKAGLTPREFWLYYMRKCVEAIPSCHHMVMLSGWRESEGAHWEFTIATMLGITTSHSHESE